MHGRDNVMSKTLLPRKHKMIFVYFYLNSVLSLAVFSTSEVTIQFPRRIGKIVVGSYASQLLFSEAWLHMRTLFIWTNHSAGHMQTNLETAHLDFWLAGGAVSTSGEAILPTLSAIQQSGLNNIKSSIQTPFYKPSCRSSHRKIKWLGNSCALVNHHNSSISIRSPARKEQRP